ncbi:hypothetical protein RDMS_08855 [Deinococcus sp. RL]|uniref:protein kinase domain-containing protein n=1 Tax=Deinococcus sp. RL TaxID=1489678 RepID=UPI0004D4AB49|nr:protein kinase [Deinococcus sp. RL]KEF34108.1 hypothetical protein RDMS_08855 [Deinococcus sp. RL]
MTQLTYLSSAGQTVRLGQELGVGGQGAVYAVVNQPDVVAKIYLQTPDEQAVRKLEALVQVADEQLVSVSAWPQSVLRDSAGRVRGFLMPLVSDAEYQELHVLYRPMSRRTEFPKADWRFLVHVARNVARAFAVLHARNHLMGDVSARNVMVSQNGTVRFIDTDSFQVQVGGQVFVCPVGTAEFTPPELQGQAFGSLVRNVNHDLFGLALLLFHLLFEGRHPYAGVHDDGSMPSPAEAIAGHKFAYSLQRSNGVKPPPFALTLKSLPDVLQTLFERAFAPNAASRPTARQWDAALADLFANLVTCAKNSAHVHDRRVPCPWCALLPSNAQAATAKGGVPGAAKRIDVDAELNRIWQGVKAIPVPGAPPKVAPPTSVSLLPLPPTPSPPPVVSGVSTSAVVWGVTYAFFAVVFLVNNGFWLAVVLAGLAWFNFAKNSAQNVAKREEATRMQLRAQQLRAHLLELDQYKARYQREAAKLRQQLAQAEARRQTQSAYGQYRTFIQMLEALREQVRALPAEEQRELMAVVERHRKPLLERYLAQHVIRPGVVNGIGPGVVASLNQHGIRTARDINVNIHRVKGVGPKRQQDLLAWRDTLEQFFQFNPALVPPSELEAVRDRFDQKKRQKLQEIELTVQKLAQASLNWTAAEQRVVEEVRALQLELARREATIQFIQQHAASPH